MPDVNTALLTPDLSSIFTHFAPELILVIGALALLGYDLVVRGRDARQPWIALGVLLAAIAATGWLYGSEPTAIFSGRAAAEGGGFEIFRPGAFVSDGFTHFFRLLSMLTAALVSLSGITYMRGRTAFKGEFYAFVLFAALAMNLMAGANDLIMIALSIEFLSLVSYVLTGYLREDDLSIEGGLKYFLYGSITSAAMLMGLSYLYGIAGSTSLPHLATVVAQPQSELVSGLTTLIVPAGLLLVMAGIGFKVALVPFHQWSPDAYQGAPTPVTAFLSVGPKAAGFAVMLRILATVFGTPAVTGTWLGTIAVLAGLTMIIGNVAALTQNDVKRLMAYSSIAQAGYMLVGVAAFGQATMAGTTPLGSVLFFILAYLFTNLGAFAVIIAVNEATGSSSMGAFANLARRAPFLAVALTVFFLSLIGIPPLSGFFGKFVVFGAAVSSGHTSLAVLGVLTGVISAMYYFRIVKIMFFGGAAESAEESENATGATFRPSPTVSFVVAACLTMTLIIGLLPQPFIDIANQAVEALQPLADAMASR